VAGSAEAWFTLLVVGHQFGCGGNVVGLDLLKRMPDATFIVFLIYTNLNGSLRLIGSRLFYYNSKPLYIKIISPRLGINFFSVFRLTGLVY